MVNTTLQKSPFQGGKSSVISRVGIGLVVNTKLKRSPFQGRGGGGFTYDIEDRGWVDSKYTITEKSLPRGFTYDIEGRDWVDSEYKITEKSHPGGCGEELCSSLCQN